MLGASTATTSSLEAFNETSLDSTREQPVLKRGPVPRRLTPEPARTGPSATPDSDDESTRPASVHAGTHLIDIPAERAFSQLLAERHGQVTEVFASTFTAQLKGRHGEGVRGKEEEAEIPIEEVRPGDLDLLQVGAFFRLCVSYEISRQGNRRRYTDVVFRRLPAYRRDELERAREQGREIARGLRLE
jgi:hypothetical protein